MKSDPGSPHLDAAGLTKRFGRFTALNNVSFSVARGELVCLLGPSGCGKTTALRVVAGLERPDEGRVLIGGRDVTTLPVSRRNIGIVFQSYALFPNLSVAANVAYGLENQAMERASVRQRVVELLELVGLAGLEAKYPAQLSGGQQQRVALARAMALSPDVLLLDEPLSALDAQVRAMLRVEIRNLQQRLGVTTIMVTHDQEEALTMADRILVMQAGRIVQDGRPGAVYDEPATPFVAGFIGSMNFLPDGLVEDGETVRVGPWRLRHSRPGPAGRSMALVAFRPEDVGLAGINGHGPDGEANKLSARVDSIEFRGAMYRLGLTLPLHPGKAVAINADVPATEVRRLDLRQDMHVALSIPSDRIRVYAQQ